MKTLQKVAGISSLSEAAIYTAAFIYFGFYWAFPYGGSAMEQLSYLRENQVSFSVVNLLIYILFGVFLAALVCAIYERLKENSPAIIQVATLFGALWVGLIIASGMIANIGLQFVVQLPSDNPERAIEVWSIVSLIVEALGGGNELVGGVWVLLLSIGALKGDQLSRVLSYLGLFVGMAGISTVYPADVLTEIFGLSQIVWFIWLGVSLLKDDKANNAVKLTATT